MPPKKPKPGKPKKARPGRNKTVRTERRRMIARSIVNEVPQVEIAERLGVTPQYLGTEVRAPETQAFIRGAFAPYLNDLSGLIFPAVTAVKDGLHKREQTVDRLRAVKVLGYLMELAEGRKADGSWNDRPRRFAGTMEELLILYRQTLDAPAGELAGQT